MPADLVCAVNGACQATGGRRYEQASDRLAHALARSRELGDQSVETEALNGQGEAWPAVTTRWVRPTGPGATGSVPWPCSAGWALRKPGSSVHSWSGC